VAAALKQLNNSDDEQNHRPSATEVRPMQIVQQRQPSNRNQHGGTSKATLATVASRNTGLPFDQEPHAKNDQNDGPETVHTEEPESKVV
jgi:hypothetical protein